MPPARARQRSWSPGRLEQDHRRPIARARRVGGKHAVRVSGSMWWSDRNRTLGDVLSPQRNPAVCSRRQGSVQGFRALSRPERVGQQHSQIVCATLSADVLVQTRFQSVSPICVGGVAHSSRSTSFPFVEPTVRENIDGPWARRGRLCETAPDPGPSKRRNGSSLEVHQWRLS